MKGNSKRLGIVVIIAALAMFTVLATAAADDHKGRKGIQGEYVGTTVSSCIFTPTGFNPNFTPVDPSSVSGNSGRGQHIWTFYRDGTGTFQGRQVGINFPPSKPPFNGANANLAEVYTKFTYEITDDDAITINAVPGMAGGKYVAGSAKGLTFTMEPFSQSGMVSEDHKTIILGTVTPEVATFTLFDPSGHIVGELKLICLYDRLLIRLGELESDAEKR